MDVYAGSKLELQWTLQHSCGPNSNALCTFVIQYGDDTEASLQHMRDPMPSGNVLDNSDQQNPPADLKYYAREFVSEAQKGDGTNTIPVPSGIDKKTNFGNAGLSEEELSAFYSGDTVNGFVGKEFGLHESFEYYSECYNTQRNKGVYTADQILKGDRAIYTRQNPNGQRSGLECPEERDYYPYWRASPWKDVAVFTSDIQWCEYYQAESQNVKERWACRNAKSELIPNNEDDCFAAEGEWYRIAPHRENEDISPPICDFHPSSRDNHLGNTVNVDQSGNLIEGNPETASFTWKIPENLAGKKIALRYRYNVSSSNYPSMNGFEPLFEETKENRFVDWRFNCPEVSLGETTDVDEATYSSAAESRCSDVLTMDNFPLFNRPYVRAYADESIPRLSLAINTNQVGRTFQDRSYCINVLEKPSGCREVWNLNVRGRRGNIVQTYPALEYDFVPQTLRMQEADCAHIQFMGTDFNAAKNPNNGEGWRFSSRSNMVQAVSPGMEFPLNPPTMWKSTSVAHAMGMVGQDLSVCKEFAAGDPNENNANDNCGKLNAAPAHFDGGLHTFKSGTYHYMSTRNNNFSNRSQKGTLIVLPQFSAAETVLIGLMLCYTMVFVVGAALYVYGKRKPEGKVAQTLQKVGVVVAK